MAPLRGIAGGALMRPWPHRAPRLTINGIITFRPRINSGAINGIITFRPRINSGAMNGVITSRTRTNPGRH